MGGFGSGRTGNRPVNDQSLALSFDRQLHKALDLLQRKGTGAQLRIITWSRAGRKIASIGVYILVRGAHDASMVLSYTSNSKSITEPIAVCWTRTPFGRRPWWACPGCGRRCARLYNPEGTRWRCRICYNVTYASSNESDKRLAYSRVWRLLQGARNFEGMATGALIMTLRGHKRIEDKLNRDLRRAERHPGKPGRPRKH